MIVPFYHSLLSAESQEVRQGMYLVRPSLSQGDNKLVFEYGTAGKVLKRVIKLQQMCVRRARGRS
jgi:hypothetical protein